MDDQSRPAESHDPRIDAALHEYLERVDRGEMLDAQSFVAEHEEIADELRSLIDAEVELRKLAAGDADVGGADTSTRSFALHGHETIPPQGQSKQADGSSKGGLKEHFGRYRIVRILGQGAMGTVYLAQDTQLKRQVALKTPHFDAAPSGELLERLYREARAAATLRHPNICPVHDVGEIDGTHYISMAYIEGHPLSAFVRSSKPQPERQTLIVVRKLAQALQEAHDQKIVHRDLKPANIMVDKRGEPLIMDFGLARHTRPDEDVRLTHSGTLVGTPAYMSPEQVDGDSAKIGPLTDEYSLGVILYELLTGQLPFRGSMMAVLGQIVTKDPQPPSQFRPGLDPRIEAACLRMMAKNSADRFPSLTAVADELASILKNPGARPAATGKSAGSLTLPAANDARAARDAGSSKILKSQTLKTLTGSDLESLEELARKCLNRHDYEQVIQIAERIPEQKRNAALQTLLEQARAKTDEISFLICDIDEAVRLEDGPTALKKADALLKVKPGHHRALEVQEQFGGSGEGGVVRLGPKRVAQAWREGGWIPWSALAFGVAVVGVVAGVIIIRLNKDTAILIDVEVPGIKLEVIGQQAIITVPGKQEPIKVAPGDGQLKISYEGLETLTRSFTIGKGETKILKVRIIDSELVARFENEIARSIPGAEKSGLAQKVDDTRTKTAGPTGPVGRRPPLLAAPFEESAARNGRQKWADYLQQPGEVTNTIGMKLVLIPPGEFLMGSPENAHSVDAHEKPQHKVQISHPFYFDAYEVTRGEFAKFVSATGYRTEAERDGGRAGAFDSKGDLHESPNTTWNNPGFEQSDSHPVVVVSWNDATAFCRWLSEKEGQTYRLPTEAEWEYACRAGTTTSYSSGDNLYDLVAVGNCLGGEFQEHFHLKPRTPNDKRPNDGYVFTAPVGSFRPNPFGLFDMHGNAWEWCQDWFSPTYYAGSPTTDPTGPPQGSKRVSRGGGLDCGFSARSATRDSNEPAMRAANLGFRVMRVLGDTGGETTPTPVEQTASPTAAVPSEDGFVPLFNGKDLSGWTRDQRQPGEWRAKDGILSGGGPSEPSTLYSDRADYRDFHLRAEVRLTRDASSGLCFRTEMPPPESQFRKPTSGFEVELTEPKDRDAPRTGSVYGLGSGGPGGQTHTGFKCLQPILEEGKWFTVDVFAEGLHTVVMINGRTTLDNHWVKQNFRVGRIALQQHVGKPSIEFRKIEIKELAAASTTPVAGGPKTAVLPADKDALIAPFDDAQALAGQQKWSDRLKTPVDLINKIKMRLRLIPPGQFQMGINKGADFQGPAHQVQITRPFYLGIYEVTRSQFANFVAANHGYKSQSERHKSGLKLDNAQKPTKWDPKHRFTWQSPGFAQDGSHPVINVSWDDAHEFCAWLSRTEGKTYRLPTEAEWEYACRAGTDGSTNESMTQIGNFADATAKAKFSEWRTTNSSDGYVYTSPVGQFRPNNFGLYDTLGNALEWCSDWWDADYYKTSPDADPPGPSTGTCRIARGGCFTSLGDAVSRWDYKPDHHAPDCGFRVVCEISTGPPTSAAVSPPATDNRHAWLGETSRFDNVAAGKWRETFPKQPGHAVYFFDEAARTPESIELIDKTRIKGKGGVSVQLADNQALIRWGGPGIPFKPLQAGQWETTPEAAAASAPPVGDRKSIFNGTDLAGWHGLPGYWHVKDRAIVGSVPTTRPKAQTFLCSRREYKDFELKFRARLLGGVGNSGVQFRSKIRDPKILSMVGPQCEIVANEAKRKYPAGSLLTEPSGEPAIAPAAAVVDRIFKAADFNDFEIRCVGQHVRIKVNGETTVDADFPSMPESGLIGWQMHKGNPPREVTFRDIEFTDLSAAPALAPTGGLKSSSNSTGDRRAAEAVLAAGGAVTVRVDGREAKINPGGTLPPEPMELTLVDLSGSRNSTDAGLVQLDGATHLLELKLFSSSVTDAGLEHLRGLTNLQSLSLWNTRVTDAGLANVEGLGALRRFTITSPHVTDAGIVHLSKLTQLSDLNLGGTEVTDAGLRHIENLTNIDHLWLHRTRVTDAGLGHLENLNNLRVLVLERTRVTGAGLAHLRNLKQLEELDLSGTKVTDAGLVPLRELTSLRSLRLDGTAVSGLGLGNLKPLVELRICKLSSTHVTDSGLAQLKGLPRLQKVWLKGTRVTDAGLKHFASMMSLDELDLSDTNVTAAGVEKLRRSLPACRITANPKDQ